jgi:hypothetical protein
VDKRKEEERVQKLPVSLFVILGLEKLCFLEKTKHWYRGDDKGVDTIENLSVDEMANWKICFYGETLLKCIMK